MTGSITINDMDEATAHWIEGEAKRRGADRESLALSLIRKGIECESEYVNPDSFDDLDSLAGTWSEDQESEFLNAIRTFEEVDDSARLPELMIQRIAHDVRSPADRDTPICHE